jgi:hypothetical protein
VQKRGDKRKAKGRKREGDQKRELNEAREITHTHTITQQSHYDTPTWLKREKKDLKGRERERKGESHTE